MARLLRTEMKHVFKTLRYSLHQRLRLKHKILACSQIPKLTELLDSQPH